MNLIDLAQLGAFPMLVAIVAFLASWYTTHKLAKPDTELSIFGLKYTKKGKIPFLLELEKTQDQKQPIQAGRTALYVSLVMTAVILILMLVGFLPWLI